jgi:PAS domain S-box-containing protein
MAPQPDQSRSVGAPPSVARWASALGGLALLCFCHPLTWGRGPADLWSPFAGIGLALIAWLGFRGTFLVLLAGALATLRAWLAGTLRLEADGWDGLALPGFEVLLTALELHVAWWAYHHLARGARGLSDPRSAILFLLLVPGAAAAAFALARALLSVLLDPRDGPLSGWLATFWLSDALGLLVVAPPLLVAGTAWLSRRGLARDEFVDAAQLTHRAHLGATPLTRGDAIEIAGLSLGASLLALLLAFLHGRNQVAGWQLWGAPLLLILWASLRQGLRGGTIAAGTSAALPLLVLSLTRTADIPIFTALPSLVAVRMLQTNLLAQCGTALLVSASASWIRVSETRYRQVVGHIPVVVYSARFVGPTAEVTLVSAASTSLLGCAPDQLLGDYDRWLQRVHPDDREILRAALCQLSRQKQPVTCEYRLAPAVVGVDTDPAGVLAPGLPRPLRPAARWVRDTLAPHRETDGRLSGWEGVVTDVTEQRALADDLRRTTSMFDALVANLPAGVFFVQGPHGRPILVNARARQLLGQREDASAGLEHLADVYHLFRPDGSPYPVAELPVYRALREGSTAMRDDIVVHRPDGRRIPLISWAAPVFITAPGVLPSPPGANALRGGAEAGSPAPAASAVWVLEDLTALHQAEAAHRDTEVRLRAVIETMGEGLLVHDRKGAVVECNPTACALLGRSAEGLRGRALAELDWSYLREDGSPLPPDEHPVAAVLRLGRPVRHVVLGLTSPRADAVRWILLNAMPLGGCGPAVTGVVTTFSEITSHVRAQKLLRLSEEKYRGLVESLPLSVIQSDRELRVLYANPATKAITGYDLADIAEPVRWQALIHADDLPLVRDLARDTLAGEPARGECRYRARDGSEKVAYMLLQPRWQDGRVIGVTTMMVDMTRERRLEQELQRAQRLELIGRLSSGIAHDFNNLLAVVMSLTDLARDNLPDEHPVRDDLQRINDAAEHAANLAAQLLAFSRQRRILPQRVEVNAVARRTLELLRATLPAAIRLEARLDSPEPFVQADETQLQQVLMNLCLNARDAMPAGGTLRVRTETVAAPPSRGFGAAARWVRLSVHDEGEGMSDHVKARIFDPFFSTKERGTGLGLAVVQQIVESYGGRIEVNSQPGRGARFDVWIPEAVPEPAVV